MAFEPAEGAGAGVENMMFPDLSLAIYDVETRGRCFNGASDVGGSVGYVGDGG
jgi:hypothetical protein